MTSHEELAKMKNTLEGIRETIAKLDCMRIMLKENIRNLERDLNDPSRRSK